MEVLSSILGDTLHKGRNYFHDACADGSVLLLLRVTPYLHPDHLQLVRAYDHDGYQPIHVAARTQVGERAAKIIDRLIVFGAHINAKDRRAGETALHQATVKSDGRLVEWLCKQDDIGINAVNFSRLTPYQLAWLKNDTKLMKILEDHGADTTPPPPDFSSDDSDDSDDN